MLFQSLQYIQLEQISLSILLIFITYINIIFI